MEEITRFFESLFRSIIYRFKYIVLNISERQFEKNFNQQVARLQQPKQQPKQQEQAEDDRK